MEEAIVKGPPTNMFRPGIDQARLEAEIDNMIWARIVKIKQVRDLVTNTCTQKLEEIMRKHPKWGIEESDNRESSPWMEFNATPRRRRNLVDWLNKYQNPGPWKDDDWKDRCRNNFPTTSCALYDLSRKGIWPIGRWKEAFQAWSDEPLIQKSWRYISLVVINMPSKEMLEMSGDLGQWLEAASRKTGEHQDIFFQLASRFLEMDYGEDQHSDDVVHDAINHPIGFITQALVNRWHPEKIGNDQGLSGVLQNMFTMICDPASEKSRLGRVILTKYAIEFLRIDPGWVREHMLPLFNWRENKKEAQAAWQGFFLSVQDYRSLPEALNKDFLDTADHYGDLGILGDVYVACLTYAALDSSDRFNAKGLAAAVRTLPEEGLVKVLSILESSLSSAGEQKTEYWKNRVRPFIDRIWPKTVDINSTEISNCMAELCIAAEDDFPDALSAMQYWLIPTDSSDEIMHTLLESELCEKFPEEALGFLSKIVDSSTLLHTRNLEKCLESIETTKSELADNDQFRLLKELA